MSRARPHWRTSIGLVAGLAAFAATASLALTRNGSLHPRVPVAPLATLGPLEAAPGVGRTGPEGVPIPSAASLAPPRAPRVGERIDGIACQKREQVAFHIHAHLRIVVRGASRRVPAGIGVASPYELEQTPLGPFVAAAPCFMWLHTHAADGIIHIESPTERTYTLGELFDIWGQPLGHSRIGPERGAVTALFDRRVFRGNPRQIPLVAHSQIELEVGRPLVAPDQIAFPGRL